MNESKVGYQIILRDPSNEILLHQGMPFWHTTTAAPFYDSLTNDLVIDVCIIGGGMSGALISHEMIAAGLRVVVLDKAQPGRGSSNGNTGMIQYHSDRFLADYVTIDGAEKALDFYQLCYDAMHRLENLVAELPVDVGYRKLESVYITYREEDKVRFLEEVDTLTRYGFPAKYVDEQALLTDYDLVGKHGIITYEDAMINPYKLIQAIHERSRSRGVLVFGDTAVTEVMKDSGDEQIRVITQSGPIVRADHVIFCTGYAESFAALKGRDRLHSTYSLVTNPIAGELWADERMVWDAEEPYLYFRVTEDHRIIAGGFDGDSETLSDIPTIEQTAEALMSAIRKYYPPLQAEPVYAWQSVFGVSQDELPFIGPDPAFPGVYYALGFGGNGTSYSLAAADILTKLIQGQPHPFAYTVDPSR